MRTILTTIFTLLCLSSVTMLNISHAKSLWQQSYILQDQGKYQEAAEILLPKIQNSVKSEFALLRYAWLNYLAGNYNKAIKSYKDAIAYNANSLDARLGIMLPLMAQSRWREATLYGEQVIATAPWQYHAHIRIMACESAQLMWSKLETHASLVNERYPSDADVLIYLARARANLKKIKEARLTYQKVIEILPANTEALQFIVGTID